jgi:hypothetical protein
MFSWHEMDQLTKHQNVSYHYYGTFTINIHTGEYMAIRYSYTYNIVFIIPVALYEVCSRAMIATELPKLCHKLFIHILLGWISTAANFFSIKFDRKFAYFRQFMGPLFAVCHESAQYKQ